MHRIDAIRFGIAGGLTSGLIFFVLTLLALATGYGIEGLNVFRSFFPGFEISIFGSILGAIYGFCFGFVELFVLAFIYNLLGPPPGPPTQD
jgi:hypothetical protein